MTKECGYPSGFLGVTVICFKILFTLSWSGTTVEKSIDCLNVDLFLQSLFSSIDYIKNNLKQQLSDSIASNDLSVS